MAMSVGSSQEGDVMVEMNTTPLIDVMLVLLIMLIVTIPVQSHAVKLDMPRPNQNQPQNNTPREVVDLEIDFDGTVMWNGNIVANEKQLQGYLLDIASRSPQPEIHLRPNRLCKYD